MLEALYETTSMGGGLQQLALRFSFPQELVRLVGAPATMWTIIRYETGCRHKMLRMVLAHVAGLHPPPVLGCLLYMLPGANRQALRVYMPCSGTSWESVPCRESVPVACEYVCLGTSK